MLAAIDTLGFVPKLAAAERARKSGQRIGVLAPFFTYPSFVQRLRGITERLAGLPYELVIYTIDRIEQRDSYLINLPLTRRVDGLILMSMPLDTRLTTKLVEQDMVTVLVEYTLPQFSSIEIDDYAGGQMVAEFLVGRGHRRFAFVGDRDVQPYALPVGERRLQGFAETLEHHGLLLPPAHIRRSPHGLEAAHADMEALLALPEPPTAIFAGSDTQALGVLKAARQRGLRIPEDVAIVGFDDIEVADYVGLTTVRQHLTESGHIAVEMLISRLERPNRPPQRVHLPLELIVRTTT